MQFSHCIPLFYCVINAITDNTAGLDKLAQQKRVENGQQQSALGDVPTPCSHSKLMHH